MSGADDAPEKEDFIDTLRDMLHEANPRIAHVVRYVMAVDVMMDNGNRYPVTIASKGAEPYEILGLLGIAQSQIPGTECNCEESDHE